MYQVREYSHKQPVEEQLGLIVLMESYKEQLETTASCTSTARCGDPSGTV